MPVKPDPVNDLPPPWGSAGNYAGGVYSPALPWGTANPLAGQPLPWGGQPRLNTTGLTGFAANGLTPQVPTEASVFNEWLRRVAIWQTDWVALGTSDPDADAHLMETDASGFSSAQKYIAAVAFETPGDLTVDGNATLGDADTDILQVNASAIMPALGATTLRGVFNVVGPGAGFVGEIRSDATGTLDWFGAAFFKGRFNLTGAISVGAGDFAVDAGDLLYNDGVNNHYVHKSQAGFVNGFGESLTPAAALNVLVDTSAAIAPLVATDLKITGTAWVQRDGAGDCTVSLEEVAGIGTLGTADAISVPDDAGTDRKMVVFTRIRAAADTTPRVYRMRLTGGGISNITAINMTITVTEAP